MPAEVTTSAGQVWPATPVQVSSGSQESPEPLRQTTPKLSGASSVGHAADDPVQNSLTSQESPEPARQSAPLGKNTSAGHVALEPVHVSVASQKSEAGRHVAPAARRVQVLVQQDVGSPLARPRSHCSGLSTTPSPHDE